MGFFRIIAKRAVKHPILYAGIGLAPALVLILLLAISEPAKQQNATVPLPTLPEGHIQLRVAYIENPSMETFTESEWHQVLDSAASLLEQHIGLSVTFETFDRLDIAGIFKRLDAAMPDTRKDDIAPYLSPEMDWTAMVPMVAETLRRDDAELDSVLAYLNRHTDVELGPLRGVTVSDRREQLSRLAVAFLYSSLTKASETLSGNLRGGAERDSLPGYNEWIYWDSIPALDLNYDVYLTNQGVVSVEYAPYPIHVIVRGGVTGGTTSASQNARYGTASWISAYPFLDRSDFVTSLRGGRNYPREDAVQYAGLLLAHELGHMLLHLAHPWENPACIMYPTEALQFAEAYAQLDSDACRLRSSAPMTPGAVPIPTAIFSE
ncbi:MAG: hypothetical protein RIM33_03390 [Alphaproteobacteria bacterium]